MDYDIDQEETPYSSNRTSFVCTHSKESNLCLAQPVDKVKKTWYNQRSNSELKVDPKFATDKECYEMEATLMNIDPNVIQATFLGPLIDLPSTPTFLLNPGSKLQAHLPSGLPITTLIDTGCHKTILNRKFLQKHPYHFKDFKKVLLKENHKIKLANDTIIKTDGLIALPIIIQDYLFQFLVLVTTLSEEYEFVIGLEALIQMEATYFLGHNALQLAERCIPLYTLKDFTLPPNCPTVVHLTGQLPSTFSSGFAVVHITPLRNTLSIITTEAEFINQMTCFTLRNTDKKSHTFTSQNPFAYFDTRSIGYYDPLPATQMVSSDHLIFPSHLASISHTTYDRLIHEEPALGTKDPYPWLDSQDP